MDFTHVKTEFKDDILIEIMSKGKTILTVLMSKDQKLSEWDLEDLSVHLEDAKRFQLKQYWKMIEGQVCYY